MTESAALVFDWPDILALVLYFVLVFGVGFAVSKYFFAQIEDKE